jgi:CD109 antigen
LTSALETKIKRNIQTGYQNQLSYKHQDGSYSAFGKKDPIGSTWLTAYTLKTFIDATKNGFFIDPNVIETGFAYLSSVQDAQGSFQEKGNVIHKGKRYKLYLLSNKKIKSHFVLHHRYAGWCWKWTCTHSICCNSTCGTPIAE